MQRLGQLGLQSCRQRGQAGLVAQVPGKGLAARAGVHLAAARVGPQGLHQGLPDAATGADDQGAVALTQAVQSHQRTACGSYTQRKPMYTA